MFNVVDIGFNSIFLKANKDLIILLKEFNLDSSKITNYAKLTERNILRFFDKKKGAFCLLYTSPSPRDVEESRMPSSA